MAAENHTGIAGPSRQIEELVGIARAMVADGRINQGEIEFLKKWLLRKIDSDEQRLLHDLYGRVEATLIKGALDERERDELLGTLSQIADRDLEFIGDLRPILPYAVPREIEAIKASDQLHVDHVPKGGWTTQKPPTGDKIDRSIFFKSTVLVGAIFAAAWWIWFVVDNTTEPARVTHQVSSSQYGSDWPFSFSEGALGCEEKTAGGTIRPMVTLTNGKQVWGLNGAAIGVGEYLDHRVFLPRDPVTGAYAKGSDTVARLIQTGLELCRRN
ncbi:hypothetical protein GOC49_04580 [Sinorhizobium meliloti]|nr:hypothetical protein [Sinorhizobium meliloti]